MPINYKEYPPDWKEIRERILKRANNCCEFCGVKNGAVGYRENGNFIDCSEMTGSEIDSWLCDTNIKLTKIVLTIAHLDHDKKNWNVKDERLKALCQRCHLQYDLPRHILNRKYGKRENQLTLFTKGAR